MTIFLILGTLQLFMMLQARIIAQYAAYNYYAYGLGFIAWGLAVSRPENVHGVSAATA